MPLTFQENHVPHFFPPCASTTGIGLPWLPSSQNGQSRTRLPAGRDHRRQGTTAGIALHCSKAIKHVLFVPSRLQPLMSCQPTQLYHVLDPYPKLKFIVDFLRLVSFSALKHLWIGSTSIVSRERSGQTIGPIRRTFCAVIHCSRVKNRQSLSLQSTPPLP